MLATVFSLAVSDADATPLVQPALIFALSVAGAIGMMFVLPGRRETPIRKLGGVVLLATLLIFAALLAKRAAGMSAYFWIFSAIALVSAVRVITHTKPVYSALYFVLTVMASAGLFVLMNAEFMAAALVLIYAGAILVTYVFVIMLASEAAPKISTDDSAVYGLAPHDALAREPIAASAIGFALVGVLLFVIFDGTGGLSAPDAKPQTPGVQTFNLVAGNPVVQPTHIATATPGDVDPLGGGTKPGLDRSKFEEVQKNLATEYVSASAMSELKSGSEPAFIPVGQTQQLGAYLFKSQLVSLELAGVILTVAMVGAIMIARRRIVRLETEPAYGSEVVTAPATPIDDDPHSIPVFGTENPRQKAYPET